MTAFYIVLLIGIVLVCVLISLRLWIYFYGEMNEAVIITAVIIGLWLCLFLHVIIVEAVNSSGLKLYDKEVSNSLLVPIEGDSIFMRVSCFIEDYYLFETGEGMSEFKSKHCEIVYIPDTIHPYCEIYNCSLKSWAGLFYRENSWMAKQKSVKIYISDTSIRDERPAQIEIRNKYLRSRKYRERLYESYN